MPPATLSADAADTAPAPRTVSAAPSAPQGPPVDLRLLKYTVWLYIALWIGEGALRKWIFPSHASPLLVVRDPVLLFLYALALAKGVFPRGAFIGWIAGISFVALAFSLIGSKAPLLVQLYGYRSDFLHLPLIFLIPNVFDRDDLRKVGLAILVVGLPMSFLVLMQFAAGQGSRLNVGVGGEGTMLDAAFGHIRPSGTFSFGNGLGEFSGLVAAFCVFGVLQRKSYPRLIWAASVPALAILILLSGSRAAVGLVVIVLLTVFFICLLRPRFVGAAMKIAGVCGLGAATAGSFAIFRSGLEVFAYRFGDAADVREGFVDRFFSAFLEPFHLLNVVDFYGVGLGMGTNVGSGLILEGQRKFLYAENELGRVMFESGPVVGPIYLLLRLAIVLYLFARAVRTLRKDGHPLAILLLSACTVDLLLGQFGQATTLGFTTIAAGLCLAANRAGASESAVTPGPASPQSAHPLPPLPAAPRAAALRGNRLVEHNQPLRQPTAVSAVAGPARPRGRSPYAERMHREAEDEVRRTQAEGRTSEEENANPE